MPGTGITLLNVEIRFLLAECGLGEMFTSLDTVHMSILTKLRHFFPRACHTTLVVHLVDIKGNYGKCVGSTVRKEFRKMLGGYVSCVSTSVDAHVTKECGGVL